MYDCTDDVLEHKLQVTRRLEDFISQLEQRALFHDDSKLGEWEKPFFDIGTPHLGKVEFGSDDYERTLTAMKEGVSLHYAANRHHPEHFTGGINEMTLADVVEMFCDWLAAADRKGVPVNWGYLQQRFGLDPQLVNIFRNSLEITGDPP